jgi:uncharacterized protein (UPF0264 family)
MTSLLVSVRSAEEARAAIAGGADWIDVKEPLGGPLGAADPAVWRQVQEAVGYRLPLSAAMGELIEQSETSDPPAQSLDGYRFAKAGLSRCAELSDWQTAWRRWAESLPRGVAPVGVIYADWAAVGAPSPEQTLAVTARRGAKAALVDTFDKSRGGLFAHLAAGELERLLRTARSLGMLTVVGGSLNVETLPAALRASPDVIAVRGAACLSGRDSAIDEASVRRLKRLSRGFVKAPPCPAD